MTRLLIVDDHTMMRQLLAEELGALEDIEVAGSFSTGEEALTQLFNLSPDVVVLDISLPGRDGIDVAAEMRTRGFDKPILCLSMHLSNALASRAFAAGANGYAAKHEAFEDLVGAIRTLANGGRYVSPMLNQNAVTGEAAAQNGDQQILDRLSRRERQIVSLFAAGKKTTEIAGQLNISERTVDFHRRNLNEKTGLGSIAELTKFAIRTGLSGDA